jgi:hypothetical protein
MPGSLKDQISLSKDYLPSPARSTVSQLRDTLPQPQPKPFSCIGCITVSEAMTALTMPFSREEDDVVRYCIALFLVFKCSG